MTLCFASRAAKCLL